MQDLIDVQEIVDPTDAQWLRMRGWLWPHSDSGQHQEELEGLISDPSRHVAFLAVTSQGEDVGFAEISMRTDYVNGCDTSPVAFLEGIYVCPQYRRRGVARLLCEAAERWGQSKGCTELASDALMVRMS